MTDRPAMIRGTRGRRHRHVWAMGMIGGLIALAVWGKLRFVSDVPRMAYAEPEAAEAHADGRDDGDAGVPERASERAVRRHP